MLKEYLLDGSKIALLIGAVLLFGDAAWRSLVGA
jgi:hypothetical protein